MTQYDEDADRLCEPCEYCGATAAFNCTCTQPDWEHECENCGQTPIVPITGLCGPCTFGEAATAGGNW